MTAFPTEGQDGMQLRDYFAAQALIGLATLYAHGCGSEEATIETNARLAYAMADEMMQRRLMPCT